MTSKTPAVQPSTDREKQVDQILASPELMEAIERDDFKRFLDHIPIAIAVSRIQGGEPRIVYANPTIETLTQRPVSAIVGSAWDVFDDFVHEDDPERRLGKAVSEAEDFVGTFTSTTEAGTILVQGYSAVIQDDDGNENYRIVALVDVTDRDRAQREEYEKKIKDKDLLLRELQHRVKNNLQLILALLRLESRGVKRGEPVDLERLASRIMALSLLYQVLSADGAGSDIDLGVHFSQIASAIVQAHGRPGIELDLKVGHCPVSINVAMPAGLILNELLTNSFKYAFAGRDRGKITIVCSCQPDGKYRIEVADDGVGLPKGQEWPQQGKLGALVLQTLRENAKADVSIHSKPGKGVRVSIEFEHVPPSKRN